MALLIVRRPESLEIQKTIKGTEDERDDFTFNTFQRNKT